MYAVRSNTVNVEKGKTSLANTSVYRHQQRNCFVAANPVCCTRWYNRAGSGCGNNTWDAIKNTYVRTASSGLQEKEKEWPKPEKLQKIKKGSLRVVKLGVHLGR